MNKYLLVIAYYRQCNLGTIKNYFAKSEFFGTWCRSSFNSFM